MAGVDKKATDDRISRHYPDVYGYRVRFVGPYPVADVV